MANILSNFKQLWGLGPTEVYSGLDSKMQYSGFGKSK